jgi:hypothetical protein
LFGFWQRGKTRHSVHMPKTTLSLCVFILLTGLRGDAQMFPPAILEVQAENLVIYHPDDSEYAKRATVTTPLPFIDAKNFSDHLAIGDVISVNGRPARGTLVFVFREAGLTPTPNPGQAVADVQRTGVMSNLTVELQDETGQAVGSIMASGLIGGPRPPGSPLTQVITNAAVIGGTGVFLGVRGQMGTSQTGSRATSGQEDPSLRRVHGANNTRPRYVFHLLPAERSAIAVGADGTPLVYHADFTPVTAMNPARTGETIIIQATGLGPTRPGIAPGDVFPANPQEVAAPVEVLVNGRPAEVINKVGWPGTTDRYRIDVRMPEASGTTATLRLLTAWVPGSETRIPVR